MNTLLQRIASNKHTSAAAVLYMGSLLLVRILKIWVPGHDAQFDQTEDLIKGAAVSYGLFMAGDSQQQTK